MAWYAELCRKNWYCINGIDMIYEYKKFLYDEWYNSLTEEQKVILEENKKHQEEQRKREINTELAKLAMMSGMITNLYNKSNKDRYNNMYNNWEFPSI